MIVRMYFLLYFFLGFARISDLRPGLLDLSIRPHRQKGTQNINLKIFGMLFWACCNYFSSFLSTVYIILAVYHIMREKIK